MAKYVVHFGGGANATVEVDADDPDAAIEAAYDELPNGLCSHCSSNSLSFRERGTVTRTWPDVEGMEPYEVTDFHGETVWSEDPEVDRLRAKNAELTAALRKVHAGHGTPCETDLLNGTCGEGQTP